MFLGIFFFIVQHSRPSRASASTCSYLSHSARPGTTSAVRDRQHLLLNSRLPLLVVFSHEAKQPGKREPRKPSARNQRNRFLQPPRRRRRRSQENLFVYTNSRKERTTIFSGVEPQRIRATENHGSTIRSYGSTILSPARSSSQFC